MQGSGGPRTRDTTARGGFPGLRLGTGGNRTVRLGGRVIVSKGLPYNFWSDISHRSIKASWPVFVAGVTALFVTVNCFFAAIYMLGDRPIANSSGSFLDSLFFSIQTFPTVGYGDMHPRTMFGNAVASVELFAGVLTSAVITGLIIYRFTRVAPRIQFANVAPIGMHDGQLSLMVRLANQRLNAISTAHARMWVLISYVTAEGAPFRRFEELKLIRDHSPLFTLSWTIMHAVDETSPLYGLDETAFAEQDIGFVVILEGYDETTGQTVRARTMYYAENIRFGARYEDMLDSDSPNRTVINYHRFHRTVPDKAAAEWLSAWGTSTNQAEMEKAS